MNRIAEFRDVDSHVSQTPLPTKQRPFSYIPIFTITGQIGGKVLGVTGG